MINRLELATTLSGVILNETALVDVAMFIVVRGETTVMVSVAGQGRVIILNSHSTRRYIVPHVNYIALLFYFSSYL